MTFTRGWDGNIKPVLLTHRNFTSGIAALHNTDLGFNKDDVYLSYMPMCSAYERLNVFAATYFGMSIFFGSEDVIKLKEDILEINPTVFAAVPRFYERIYQVSKKSKNQGGCRGFLTSKAIKLKKHNLKENKYKDTIADNLLFRDVARLFGKRIRLLISGSAKLNKKIANYIRVAASCPLVEGYGCTQTCSVTFMKLVRDHRDDHIGGPLSNCEYKLKDLPESAAQEKKRC
jgi:long-chain acyl-CoA synthetase